MPNVPGFLPSKNGLHFINLFPQVPLMNIDIMGMKVPIGNASNGLCGGMAFTTRDYFEARINPPSYTNTPYSGPLFDYLVKRLFDSFNLPGGPMKYMVLMNPTLPDHETDASKIGLTPHGRSWVMIEEEWKQKIKPDIDKGKLSPLGLIEIKSSDPSQMGHNHQVLVYGYDLNGNNLVMHIYDPNKPNDDNVTMSLNIGKPGGTTPVTYSDGSTIYCFFRVDYTFSSPPKLCTIIGTVNKAATGQPIAGASVTAGGASATTDVAGHYSILVACGTYDVTAIATGFVNKTARVAVTSGTATQNFTLTQGTTIGVQVNAHIQGIGWKGWITNPDSDTNYVGTIDQSRQIEAVQIRLVNAPAGVKVCYMAHVQNKGWMNEVCDGNIAGTTGQGLRMEAIKIRLVNAPANMHIYYRAFVQNIRWMPWQSDGNQTGTTGQGLRMEAMNVKITSQ